MCAIGGQTTVCAASREAAGFVADCVSGRGCISRRQPRYPDPAALSAPCVCLAGRPQKKREYLPRWGSSGESRLGWPHGRSSIAESGANLHDSALPVGCLCRGRYRGRGRLRDCRGRASATDASDRRGAHPVAAGRIRAVAFGGCALAQIARQQMKRSHRAVHRALWPALALAVALGFALALDLRPPPAPDEPPATEAQPP
jgi:hypothetical protein